MNLEQAIWREGVSFRGTPDALLRGLRKCVLAGYKLAEDQAKIQRILDREAKRAETMRILNISRRGGIA